MVNASISGEWLRKRGWCFVAEADWQLKYNFRKEIIIELEQKPQSREAVKVKHQSEYQGGAGSVVVQGSCSVCHR